MRWTAERPPAGAAETGPGGSMDQPTAEQALRRLDPLVGELTFEAKFPEGDPWPGGGTS